MPDYSKNFLTSMTGYVDLNDPAEDPKDELYLPKGKSSLDITADVRDILGNIVGNNYQSWQNVMTDDYAKSQYSALISRVGRPLANKLVTQAVTFNQRPELRNKGVEHRLQSFYDIGSSDKEVAGVLTNVKSAGYGVLPSFRESGNFGNQVLSGRIDPNEVAASSQSEKVKEIVQKKIK